MTPKELGNNLPKIRNASFCLCGRNAWPNCPSKRAFFVQRQIHVFFALTLQYKRNSFTRAGALPGDPEAEAVEALCPVGRPRVEGPRRADVIELGATDHQEGVLGGKEKEEVQSV